MDCSEILDGLFIGGVKAAKNEQTINQLGITHIVNISGKQSFPGRIQYHRCFLPDKEDLVKDKFIPLVNDAIEFIVNARKGNGIVLVHCQAGMSRSPCFVMAYLMSHHKMTLFDAYKLLKSKRPAIRPNIGFLSPLQCLEMELLSSNSILTKQWPKIK